MASMAAGTTQRMGHIFLSYKKGDRPTAAKLVAALEAEGFAVWWDQNLLPGEHWRETLTERLMSARCVVVLWSSLSVGAEGRFVHDEARRAQRRSVYLPVRLEDVEPPLGFGEMQSIKLIGWKGDRRAPGFRALVEAARPMVSGEAAPRSALPPPAVRRLDRRWMLAAGGGVLAAGSGAAILTLPDVRRAVGLAPAAAGASSIAVLPFRNLSGDPRQDYLGDGVSEELRNALARLGSIRVAGRASSEAFRRADEDLPKIAGKLGVAYILDGAVRSSGTKLRVTAQLVDAKTGFERWSDSFDRIVTDVISVQTEIARSVAEALRGRLPGAQAALVATPSTRVPAAYDALLRGNETYLHGKDEADYRAAVRFYDSAIAADSRYAEAYARKASALQVLAAQFEPTERAFGVVEQAAAAAQRAVDLAPGSGYAQSVLGYVLLFGRLDLASARGPYERSIQLSPNDGRVIGGYGQFAAKIGRKEESLTTLARAVSLDALNPLIHRALAQAQIAARQYRQAEASIGKALELNPKMVMAQSLLADVRLLQGDAAGAVRLYRAESAGMFRLTGLAIALRKTGDATGATAALQSLLGEFGDAAAYQQAQIHAQWQAPDKAFEALTLALSLRDSGLVSLLVDPFVDPIRQDPRFLEVTRRLGLT